MLPRLAVAVVLAAFVCPASVNAQGRSPEPDGVAPAHVAHVDGTATLEREGRAEHSPLNMPLLSGDRVRTADGRVEVLFADGSTLHLDARSTIDVQSDDLMRLTEGRMRLNIRGPLDETRGRPAGTVTYRIDSPAGSARITRPGEYRLALVRPATPLRAGGDEMQLELAVVRGAAEVFTDEGTTEVRAGERAYASMGRAPSYAYSYNSANWDAFDRWSEARRDVRLGVSSAYLPPDMQAYAPLLDEGGDWRYTQSYGYAWYPRVSPDWRPYYYGRWASYPGYGWTWIGADRFAWPTHHYGRWGLSTGVWFWIPSSQWAPANVSWAYAPGYVSWCPLGLDNRPILGIDPYRAGAGYDSPWRAWTAVSYSQFGSRGYDVSERAVNWDRFDGGRRPRFETRPSAPGFSRNIAVPRNATPIRWAGSRDLAPGRGGDRSTRTAGPPSVPREEPGEAARAEARTGGRDVALPRTQATPRYVNRGDEIIRSPTERPTPRAGSPGAPSRGEGYAIPRAPARDPGLPEPGRTVTETGPGRGAGAGETRTIPDGPARPQFARPPFDRTQGSPRTEASPFDRAQARPSGERPIAQPGDEAQGRPRVGPNPTSQPSQPRGYEPRSRQWHEAPDAAAPVPSRETAPRAYERPRFGSDAPPPPPPPDRAAPAERAPNRGEGRQPAPEGAAPRESAVPRGGGGAARPRGRGGS